MTFKDFAFFIQANRMTEASMCLGLLLGLDDPNADKALHFFVSQIKSQPGFFMRLMQLKNEVEQNQENAALSTLMSCFGLDGFDAIVALKAVKESQK